jgi:hypothetical protein
MAAYASASPTAIAAGGLRMSRNGAEAETIP